MPVVFLEIVFLLVLHVLIAVKLIVHLVSVLFESDVILVILLVVSWRVLV